jgi:hypothetical protein
MTGRGHPAPPTSPLGSYGEEPSPPGGGEEIVPGNQQ